MPYGLLVIVRAMLDVRAPARPRTTRVLAGWIALIAVAIAWGRVLEATGAHLDLGAPPFWSPWHLHLTWRVLPAIAFAAGVVRLGPRYARSLSWRALLVATAFASAGWAIVLAVVDSINGVNALTDPTRFTRNDYLQVGRSIRSLPHFLRTFCDVLAIYPQHAKSHPPGFVVLEWLLNKVGLASDGWNAALVVAGAVAAGIAALVALREVADEDAARRVAPFLVLVPAAIWWETADAFFAGVSAWSVALLVLASGRTGRRSTVYAVLGGLGFGVTAFLSYGLVPLVLLPILVCAVRRQLRVLAIAAVSALPPFLVCAALGFSWFSGFAAVRHQYLTGVAIHRPYTYFLVADLALFAVATGPAVAVGLSRLRDRRVWLLVGSVATLVALADVSGMSKGEVERIWLPFVPWMMLATASLTTRTRRWLVLQAACTLIVGLTVWSQW